MNERLQLGQALLEYIKPRGHRLAILEETGFCNRRCPYCEVPRNFNPESELTLEETKRVIDRLYSFGFRIFSILGGEPLADSLTKEGIPLSEHTTQVVKYAMEKGVAVNITSNGDYLTEEKLEKLKRAGLNALTLSLHSYTKQALDSLCMKASAAAKKGILPIISTVFTKDRTEAMPGIANYITSQGIFFGIGICQSYGGRLSPECPELIPTFEQQRYVFETLLQLKPYGLIRTNRNYLRKAPLYYPNNWKCNPSKDAFIYVGSSGTLDVCAELETGLSVANIKTLKDESWRKIKTVIVRNCGGCLHQCYFELENQDLMGDIPTAMMMGLIVSGKGDFVKKWGELTSKRVTSTNQSINWKLELK